MSISFSRFSTLVTIIFIALLGLTRFMVHLDRALARPFSTIPVSNINDSGAGSLRQAILDANASAGDDLIEITAVGTLILQSPLPTITESVTIQGPGTTLFKVDGQNLYRVFDIGIIPVTIADLTVQQGNITGNDANGGGIRSGKSLMLSNIHVLSNTAQSHGGGLYATGSLTMSNTLFQNNRSLGGFGGGLFGGGFNQLNDTQFLSNRSQWSGGGLYTLGEVSLTNGLFQGNQCLAANCDGGGLFSFSQTTIQNTQFLSNTAQDNGGGAFSPGNLIINGGLFQNNQTTFGTGGGLYGQDLATLTSTQFRDNVAGSSGGGLYMLGTVTVTSSLFEQNQSINAAGGGLYVFGQVTVDSSRFLGNSAVVGGGVYHDFDKDGRFTNTLFADNQAVDAAGSAMLLNSSGSIELIHVTVGGESSITGAAIEVLSGTVGISNTIIVSHAIGISRTSGTVSQDYNLFFGNGSDTQGVISSGVNNVSGDPNFIDPLQDNYHLSVGSAAINVGTDVGIVDDFDGEIRPLNGGFDIGFDELNLVDFLPNKQYLPLIIR